MRDQQFLAWVHDRLRFVHGEPANVDYMHKLRSIILATPEDQETPNTGGDINHVHRRAGWLKLPSEALDPTL